MYKNDKVICSHISGQDIMNQRNMQSSFTIIIFFLFSVSYSQQIEIKGNIIDEDKFPIAGVEIKNLNSNILNYSDFNGNFKFKCKKGDRISFSSFGKEVSIITAKDSSFLKIVLISNYSTHSDGYTTENIHNFQILTNQIKNNFILDYRFSFSHYSKNEIGRKPVHTLTNHLDFGLSYLNFDRKYTSLYSQINNFFVLQNRWLGNWNYSIVSPYVNIGIISQTNNLKPSLRLDLGAYLVKVTYLNYLSISIDSHVMIKSYGENLFLGMTITKPISRGTGWYD